jgi:hypothetical protein
MEPLTSNEFQQLIIHLIDSSYAPFITLGGFPYPLFFAASQAIAFHGVMLLLTKLFTMGL